MRTLEDDIFSVPVAYQTRAPPSNSVLFISMILFVTQGLRDWDLCQTCVYQLSLRSPELAATKTGLTSSTQQP